MSLRGFATALLAGVVVVQAHAADKEAGHWAFQPATLPERPAVRDRGWVRTPIDAFVLARLEQEGITPAAPADRAVLLRRIYLDLIGLPPTPEEQRAFLEDHSPNAFARVVDDLLARPQYGERWARHWLDVARYAESNGYERDGAKPSVWRYRDYVIASFNKDKPFDRFVMEQLAGDEIEGASAETQIATTFLRLGTWDDEPAEPMVDRYDQLDDVLGTTATGFLGLTLRCARCHDHKFEPFTQVDYYRMLAVFEPLKRPQIGRKELDLPVGSQTEIAASLKADCATGTAQWAILGGQALAPLPVNHCILPAALHALQAAHRVPRAAATTAYVWMELGPQAPVTHVLRRGDPTKPQAEVQPGLPALLVKRQPEPPHATARSTGRRLWLARWLTQPDNPLVVRVFVNRVWQQHFGKGIVASANDFGVMGEPPSHPELLDWLASEFVARGWSMKELHRLIVLSNTYQMSSVPQGNAARLDSDGTLLSRWHQRRLQAEAVRDAMLAVSGELNLLPGGQSMYPSLPRAVLEGQSRPGEGWGKSDERQQARRSIYIFVKRVLAVPELDLLDAPNNAESCEARPVSTTAPQALTFLNGAFSHHQARQFAARLVREAGVDAKAQIERAFVLALCRPARAEELQAALEFLTAQQRLIETDARKAKQEIGDTRQRALEAYCLVLLNTNEFVYLH